MRPRNLVVGLATAWTLGALVGCTTAAAIQTAD